MSRIKKHKLKKSVVQQRQNQKKNKISKKMIWTIILGGLMVASVFGIMFSSYTSNREKMTYGEYTFQKTNTGWSIKVNDQQIEFKYFPSDLERMNVSNEAIDKLVHSSVVYITFNPNTKRVQDFELMRYDLADKLGKIWGIYSMPGITEQNDEYVQPLVTCQNATATMPVINIVPKNETEETTAYIEGDCIILKADEYTTSALNDRVLFGMLGVIK